MRIIDIAKEIQKYFKTSKIIKTKIKFQDARNYKVRNSKALKELSFKSNLQFEIWHIRVKKIFRKKN